MKMFWMIFILVGMVVILAGHLYFSNQESAYFSLPGQSQGEVTLTSSLIDGSIEKHYTESSETECTYKEDGKVCHRTSGQFTEEDGDWYTLPEVSTITKVGNAFRFEYRGYYIDIEPFVIYNGEYKTIPDIRNAFPNIQLTDHISYDRFTHKFAPRFTNIPQNVIDNIDYMGFRLVGSNLDWDDVRKEEGYLVIKDKVRIDFRDLKDSGYTLNLVNKTYLLIGKISENSEGGEIYLDPMITLDHNDIQLDYDNTVGSRPTRAGFQIRYDIIDVPKSAVIINATAFFFENCATFCLYPDIDLNLSRVNNQTWGLGDWDEVHLDNITAPFWFDINGGHTFDGHDWWLANITTQFNASYDQGWNNLSLRFMDPDALAEPEGSAVDDQLLDFGGQSKANFRSNINSNVSTRPYMEVWYFSEANAPIVSLVAPEDNSFQEFVTTPTNFTANVTEDTNIATAKLYTNHLDNKWLNIFTNSSTGLTNTTYNRSLILDNFTDRGEMVSLSGVGISTSDRRVAYNGTDWFFQSFADGITFQYNSALENISSFNSPDSFIFDMAARGREIVMIDLVSDTFYRLWNNNGTEIDSCSMQSTGGNRLYYGIDYINDTAFAILSDTAGQNNTVWFMDNQCNNFTGSFQLDRRINAPEGMICNGTTIWVSEGGGVDQMHEFGNTGARIINYSLANIFDVPTTTSFEGLARSPTDSLVENMYITPNSPNELTSMSRKLEGSLIWNWEICDTFGNCAFAPANFTLNIGVESAECWTYEDPKLFLPPGCVRQLIPGEVVIL